MRDTPVTLETTYIHLQQVRFGTCGFHLYTNPRDTLANLAYIMFSQDTRREHTQYALYNLHKGNVQLYLVGGIAWNNLSYNSHYPEIFATDYLFVYDKIELTSLWDFIGDRFRRRLMARLDISIITDRDMLDYLQWTKEEKAIVSNAAEKMLWTTVYCDPKKG